MKVVEVKIGDEWVSSTWNNSPLVEHMVVVLEEHGGDVAPVHINETVYRLVDQPPPPVERWAVVVDDNTIDSIYESADLARNRGAALLQRPSHKNIRVICLKEQRDEG